MKRKVFAILTAAGAGNRYSKLTKKSKPKQFLKIFNKPVFLFPLIELQKCKSVSGIFISSTPGYFDFIHSLAVRNKITKLKGLIKGGKTRFESVKNAFLQIEASANDLILIHDAARPNINLALINKIINEAGKSGEVIIGSRVSETVKRDRKGYIVETLNRENLWTVQTPQIFRYKTLAASYKKTKKNNFTDEASLVEASGFKVKIIEGIKSNIKITTPADLHLLKKIMKNQKKI